MPNHLLSDSPESQDSGLDAPPGYSTFPVRRKGPERTGSEGWEPLNPLRHIRCPLGDVWIHVLL